MLFIVTDAVLKIISPTLRKLRHIPEHISFSLVYEYCIAMTSYRYEEWVNIIIWCSIGMTNLQSAIVVSKPQAKELQRLEKVNGSIVVSCSVVKSCLTLRPHELQHSRLPYISPSLLLSMSSHSCPLSQ